MTQQKLHFKIKSIVFIEIQQNKLHLMIGVKNYFRSNSVIATPLLNYYGFFSLKEFKTPQRQEQLCFFTPHLDSLTFQFNDTFYCIMRP